MFVAFDGTETHAEAVAIKDGKFVYVGDEAGIAGWIGIPQRQWIATELIVLDSDIETTPAEQIQDIQVIETVFKGKTVFKKK